MAARKWSDKDLLKVKGLYLNARYVLGLGDTESKAVVLECMKAMQPQMPRASVLMYCDDAENVETLLAKKRFDKGKTQNVLSFIADQ